MNASAAHRVLWLLLELNVPYELKIHMRNPKTYLAPDELRKVHPLGKVPVVEDDGETLIESGYIVDHLISKYGQDTELAPKNEGEQKKVQLSLHHAMSLLPAEVMLLTTQKIRAESPFIAKPITNIIANRIDSGFVRQDLIKQFDYLESILKENGTGFFVGDHLSGADIIYIFPIENVLTTPYFEKDKYPLLRKWLKTMHERPALENSYDLVPDEDPSPKL
jgi:glutathione S-transferase